MTNLTLLAPYNIHDFLNVFDDVSEKGESYFELKNYQVGDEQYFHQEVSRYFETFGYGLFSFSQNIIHLKDKIDYQVVEDEGNQFLVYNLAAFLGLPSINPVEELNELKEFLIYIKDKCVEYNPRENSIIGLSRFEDEFGTMKTQFGVFIANQSLQSSLNQDILEKIEQSEVLSQWIENQKEGIVNTHTHLDNLYANFSVMSLMNENEKKPIVEQSKKTQKIQKELLKKRKF